MAELGLKTSADVEAFEKILIEDRMTAFDTYEMLKQGAGLNPDNPALVQDAIRRVCEQELTPIDELTESIAVTVVADKVHGSLANIKLKPVSSANPDDIKQKAKEILGRLIQGRIPSAMIMNKLPATATEMRGNGLSRN